MVTRAVRPRPKNPHAVALAGCPRPPDPLKVYGDLTAAQRRQHYSWVRRVGMARAAGMPAPPPPWWIRQRAMLLRYGYNEREARIVQADAKAWRGYQSLLAFAEGLAPHGKTLIRANLIAIAQGIFELVVLAGADEPEKSQVKLGMEGRLAKTG